MTEVEAYAGQSDPASHAYRRPDRPQRGHVRAAGPRLRVLHLRHALLREPGLPARRDGRGRAAAGGRRSSTGGRAGLRPAFRGGQAGSRSRAAGPRAGPAVPGAGHRPRVGRRATSATARLAAAHARPGPRVRRARGRHDQSPGPGSASARRPTCPGVSGSTATRRSPPTGRMRRRAARTQTVTTHGRRRWHDAAVTDIIDELSWRGLIAQSTDLDELRKALDTGPVTFYGGFDPTAPGLHIGNLVLLLTMRRLQLAGHRPIGLVGGATGLIGDPSGKSAERVLNPREVVADWVERIRAEVERFLDFAPGPTSALSSATWTGPRSCRRWTSCATSASTSRSTRCWPGSRSRPGWRRAGSATPSSATRSCRPSTSWSCTGGTTARCRSAAATSGGTWSRAST